MQVGTQRDIAEKIVEQKGDYVLAAKGNQGMLKGRNKDIF
jgi:hypothetical protein